MIFKRSVLLNIIVAVLIAAAISLLSQQGLLKRWELAGLDFSFRLRGNLTFNPHIVIVEITDSDIAAIGRWPWKRSWHAAIARALTDLGAKYICFDIIFSEPSAQEDDALLEEVLKTTKNVYLPFAFQEPSLDIKDAFLPIPRFSSYVKGTGAVNISPDIDGILRRIPLVFFDKQTLYPNITLKIAMDYLGLQIKDIKPDRLILSNSHQKVNIPLVKQNCMLINWMGGWKHTFKHYSFLNILAGYKDVLENKKPKINLSDFKDSVCIVGLTALGLYDIKPIPLEPVYPGIGVMATTLSNLLDKKFIYTPPYGINIFLLYLLALIPAFLILGEKPFRETLAVFLIGGIYFLINFIFFINNILLDLTIPLIGLFGSYLTMGVYTFVRVSVEKKNFFKMSVTDGLTGLYNIRYFKILLETEIMLAKPDPNKKFSILMTDVDHFKHFNDTYGHQVGDLVLKEVSDVLKNSVRSSDIVARYGGEEMIILLRGTSLKESMGLAEKIRKNVEANIVKDRGNTYKITISLGVSSFKPRDNIDKLIKRADDGLYKAKEEGRNRSCSVEL